MLGGHFSYFPCHAGDLFIDTIIIKRGKEKTTGKMPGGIDLCVFHDRASYSLDDVTQIYFPRY